MQTANARLMRVTQVALPSRTAANEHVEVSPRRTWLSFTNELWQTAKEHRPWHQPEPK